MKNIVEIWKPIVGYDGYEISNLGRVRSIERVVSFGWSKRTIKPKILKPKDNGNGYKIVGLKRKYSYIHRLVAEHFLPNPENKSEVDHINGDKTDNRVENLRWVTHKENMNNPITLNKTGKHLRKSILQFSVDGDFIKTWESIMDIQREYDINNSAIIRCCKNKQNTSCGYKWQYADDYELIPFNVFDLTIYRKKVAL